MHVAKGKDANPQRTIAPIFTGRVHTYTLINETRGEQLRFTLVKFSAGGRTTWHRHAFEQGLVIVEGKGIVATEAQEHVVEPGDVVVIGQNEKHWHGGTESTAMAHISITQPGETTVLEPVEAIKTKDA